jgi:hypothetical protein
MKTIINRLKALEKKTNKGADIALHRKFLDAIFKKGPAISQQERDSLKHWIVLDLLAPEVKDTTENGDM